MPTTMRLLLLLSAFLTAMVGVGTPAAAAVRPACEIAATASVRAERHAPCAVVAAAQNFSALNSVNLRPLVRTSAPERRVPLYAERLRV